jgi:hypothetical protein
MPMGLVLGLALISSSAPVEIFFPVFIKWEIACYGPGTREQPKLESLDLEIKRE